MGERECCGPGAGLGRLRRGPGLGRTSPGIRLGVGIRVLFSLGRRQRHFPAFLNSAFRTKTLFLKINKKVLIMEGRSESENMQSLKRRKVGHYESSTCWSEIFPCRGTLVTLETSWRALWVSAHLVFSTILISKCYYYPHSTDEANEANRHEENVASVFLLWRGWGRIQSQAFSVQPPALCSRAREARELHAADPLFQPFREASKSPKHPWGGWCLMPLLTWQNRVWF